MKLIDLKADILYLILILTIVMAFVMVFVVVSNHLDDYHKSKAPMWLESNYCVEWGGQIDRLTLLTTCYEFQTNTLNCGWSIDELNRLTIWNTETEEVSQSLMCTQYIDSYILNFTWAEENLQNE